MRISVACFILIISITGFGATADAVNSNSAKRPILPKQFAGWQLEGASQASQDAASADVANAALLKEYQFTDSETATYKSEDGRTVKIHAAQFADASGAFGAFCFYLRPEMAAEEIGDRGASLNKRVLFFRGDVLVDAAFSELTAMSAAELRALAGLLPRPSGNAATLPPLLTYVPHHGYKPNTEKYAEGPLALGAIGAPLASDLVDFSANAEVLLRQYSTSNGPATLMLIEYPTPAVAIEHVRRINAAYNAAPPQGGVVAIENVGPFFHKRTGPIVAIAAGPLSASDAQSLLGDVNYEASVTWNQNTYFDKKNNIANLLFNIILLCIIVGAISLAAGLAFGGARVLLRRYFPGPVFGGDEETEFIALHLDENLAEGSAGRAGGATGTSNRP